MKTAYTPFVRRQYLGPTPTPSTPSDFNHRPWITWNVQCCGYVSIHEDRFIYYENI
jgi:hypothetical protein